MNADFDLEHFVKSPFKQNDFQAFLMKLFGKNLEFLPPNPIPYPKQSPILTSLYFGKSELNNDKLDIYIFKSSSIKGKIALHNELKRILKNSFASAILAIFYEDDKDEFRLSLITSAFDYEANKVTFSDLKRQSFVLGHKQTASSYKTLQKLLDEKDILNMDLLKNAFSQEPLTQEFFKDYKKQFDSIISRLRKANIAIHYKGINDCDKAYKAFANKFLGRIVFLYFLQKKGWLGVDKNNAYGSGEADFLQKLFKKAKDEKENFYEKYLCFLFFESLNKQRENDFIPLFESKIPFLNGGLFDDELNSKESHFLISQILDNAFFEELFGFFDSYNFTLEESSPKEVEISIDPEMLGKIFESMMDDNKQKGAFYTPREIVHYMCQNALLLHFKSIYPHNESELKDLIFKSQSDNDFVRKNANAIKDALLKLSILDPAVGSGAFPMGLISEILSILESLNKTIDSSLRAEFKRKIIAECIYGVDIDIDAIEIAKLRFWLSIAVDEQSPKPLPNLDFKFMQGNSLCDTICGREIMPNLNAPTQKIQKNLFGYYDQKELDKISLFDKTKKDELREIFKDYFSQNDSAKKQKLKKDILSQMKEVFNARIKEINKHIDDLKSNIANANLQPNTTTKQKQQKDLKECAEYENFKTELLGLLKDYEINDFHSDKLFLYHFFFADIMEKGGFDIIIGNPPYIQLQKDGGKLAKLYEKENFASFNKMGDIYQLFFEKSLNLLKDYGVASLITSNKWMRAGYGASTREYFYNNAFVFNLIDLGSGVFESATVDTNIIFYGRFKGSVDKERIFNVKNDLSNNDNTPKTIRANKNKEWVIMDENERSIFNKISKHKALKDWDISINYGIKTGFNEAFIIDEETKNKLIKEDKKSAKLIKPILRGRDIKRYSYDFKNLYLICTFPALNLNINDYPAIKKYLKSFGKRLEQSGEAGCRKKTTNKWFETQDSIAYYKDFEKWKIVYSEIVQKPQFYLDRNGYYAEATSFILTGKHLGYIIGLLNSKFITFAFKKFYAGGGLGDKGYRYKKVFIEKLPIPKAGSQTQKEISSLVDIIIKNKEKNIDTSELEKQIDELVYKLYDLSEDEIKIVENNN